MRLRLAKPNPNEPIPKCARARVGFRFGQQGRNARYRRSANVAFGVWPGEFWGFAAVPVGVGIAIAANGILRR